MCKVCSIDKELRSSGLILKPGDTFRSKWFSGLVTVQSVDNSKDLLSVTIDPQAPGRGSWTESDWILSHTISGIQQGEYYDLQQ